MRRLHGLAVDDCRRGSGVAPFVNPHLFAKRVMHRRQRTVLAPTSEVLPNQAPRREVMRKVAPLAPRTRLVEDRVPDLPSLVLGRATSLALLGGRFARDDQLPLCSRQVRVISRPSRTYLPFHTNYYPANNNLSLHALRACIESVAIALLPANWGPRARIRAKEASECAVPRRKAVLD